ncbi:MAG: hypothetical protein Tsb004_25080 [Allomuricauda sp.]
MAIFISDPVGPKYVEVEIAVRSKIYSQTNQKYQFGLIRPTAHRKFRQMTLKIYFGLNFDVMNTVNREERRTL